MADGCDAIGVGVLDYDNPARLCETNGDDAPFLDPAARVDELIESHVQRSHTTGEPPEYETQLSAY